MERAGSRSRRDGRTRVSATAHLTAPRRGSRLADAQPVATATVMLLSVATVISMCRIFSDWAYLRPAVITVVIVHLVAFGCRVLRLPAWLAVPATLLITLVAVALVYYRDTTSLLLPTGETIDLLRADLRLVWQQFPHAVAPVPSVGSFAIASAVLLALCAVLTDAFAFRAFGRVEAIVPTGVVFVFTSALGTDRNRVVIAAVWLGAALLAVAVLRLSSTRDDTTWMGTRRRSLAAALPATMACATIAALAAGVLSPRLPGADEPALLDTRNRQGDVTQVLSPLVDIRSRLVNRGNVELFTVVADRPAYWRVIGLSEFDGTTWTPPEQPLRPAVGTLAAPAAGAPALLQTIRISRLGGNLIPAAYAPAQVGTSGLFWADDTETLILPGEGLRPGDTISVLSAVVEPPPDVLRQATVDAAPDPRYYALTPAMPDEAIEEARAATAGATSPYDQALMLQNWFRTEFQYDLTVQSGHGSDAIQNFLRIRRGYCEQFAGTFAAMARSLGLPARVAVGFTPGDLEADGRYHVFGRHAHAWAEVWFDGIGWVMFEPTPGRGAPGAEGHTGVVPAQETGTGAPGAGGQTQVPGGPTSAPTQSTSPGQGTSPNPAPATSLPRSSTRRGDAGDGVAPLAAIVLGAAALLLAWALLMPIALRRWAGGRPVTAQERVIATWKRTCGALRLAGAPPLAGATPMEYSIAAEQATGVDHRMTGEIARAVTRAVYSPDGVDDLAAGQCEVLHDQIEELCRDRLPLSTRMMARLDPRLARLRAIG